VFNLIGRCWEKTCLLISPNQKQPSSLSRAPFTSSLSVVGVQAAAGPAMGRRHLGNPGNQPAQGLKQGPGRRTW